MNKAITEYKFKDFKPIWSRKLKPYINERCLELFYECVDLDFMGRRIYPGCGMEDNPRFYTHWFAHGRCHWNVILPCYMLNNRSFNGRYKILTNQKHSVIFDSQTNTIFDPTLNDINYVHSFFEEDYQVIELFEQCMDYIYKIEEFMSFLDTYYYLPK